VSKTRIVCWAGGRETVVDDAENCIWEIARLGNGRMYVVVGDVKLPVDVNEAVKKMMVEKGLVIQSRMWLAHRYSNDIEDEEWRSEVFSRIMRALREYEMMWFDGKR